MKKGPKFYVSVRKKDGSRVGGGKKKGKKKVGLDWLEGGGGGWGLFFFFFCKGS